MEREKKGREGGGGEKGLLPRCKPKYDHESTVSLSCLVCLHSLTELLTIRESADHSRVGLCIFRVKTGRKKTTVNYFVFALSTDAESSKKDFTKFAKESVSFAEDEAEKIWQSSSRWAKPFDVYTIADDEAFFDHYSKRKCDTLFRSIIAIPSMLACLLQTLRSFSEFRTH